MQTGKRIGDNRLWRIAKLNGILYLPDVDSKTTSFWRRFERPVGGSWRVDETFIKVRGQWM